jgi:hypothetical protein
MLSCHCRVSLEFTDLRETAVKQKHHQEVQASAREGVETDNHATASGLAVRMELDDRRAVEHEL